MGSNESSFCDTCDTVGQYTRCSEKWRGTGVPRFVQLFVLLVCISCARSRHGSIKHHNVYLLWYSSVKSVYVLTLNPAIETSVRTLHKTEPRSLSCIGLVDVTLERVSVWQPTRKNTVWTLSQRTDTPYSVTHPNVRGTIVMREMYTAHQPLQATPFQLQRGLFNFFWKDFLFPQFTVFERFQPSLYSEHINVFRTHWVRT